MPKLIEIHEKHMMCNCGGEYHYSRTHIYHDVLIMRDREEYEHMCDKCGDKKVFQDKFPKIIQAEGDIK